MDAQTEGLIRDYAVYDAPSLAELREKLGDTSRPGYSRTHKTLPSGHCFGCWIQEVDASQPIGIDIESLQENPRASNIAQKLGVDPEQWIQEWAAREASFKALSRFGEFKPEPRFQDIRRMSPFKAVWAPEYGQKMWLNLKGTVLNTEIVVLAWFQRDSTSNGQ